MGTEQFNVCVCQNVYSRRPRSLKQPLRILQTNLWYYFLFLTYSRLKCITWKTWSTQHIALSSEVLEVLREQPFSQPALCILASFILVVFLLSQVVAVFLLLMIGRYSLDSISLWTQCVTVLLDILTGIERNFCRCSVQRLQNEYWHFITGFHIRAAVLMLMDCMWCMHYTEFEIRIADLLINIVIK